ncbi:MAG TPA: peptide chain release factor N(5)-glutamine methyltransferase [Woeseiaceae bacterium]|nr:peptide chain release factor N(5)-glutamine methyltransferase [Woeseiaceae bacterium]
MRIDAALARAVAALERASDSPRLDAEILLAKALGLPRSYLYAHPEDVLDDAAVLRYFESVERRRMGSPLAYITGEKEFWSLSLAVGPDVLVPRPETELLVELALRRIPRRGEYSALDLGTGSGAIAIALASERPNCQIVATDISATALMIARHNAGRHSTGNIEFLEGDWTAPVADRGFDLIVSNPPYVRDDDPALQHLRYEPRSALAAGSDGLAAIRILARDCGALLRPAGSILLEHGADQKADVAEILLVHGWSGIECYDDSAGHPRVTQANVSFDRVDSG